MLIYYLFYSFILTLVLALGFVAILKNSKREQNLVFFATTAALAGWIAGLFIADVAGDIETGLLAIRWALFFTPVAVFFFLYFSFVFPVESRGKKKKLLVLALPTVAISLLAHSEFMVKSIEYGQFAANIAETGPAYIVLLFFIFTYFVYAATILLQKRNTSLKNTSQINVVLLGLISSASLGLLFGFSPQFFDFMQPLTILTGPSVVLFIASIAYAMLKHRMFDIRLALTRSIAYVMSIALVAVVYTVLVLVLVDRFILDVEVDLSQQVVYIAATVVLAFAFAPLKNFFNHLTERIFYRDRYYTEDVLNRLGKVFVSKSNSFELLDDSLEIITSTLKVKTGYLVVMDGSDIYRIASTSGATKSAIDSGVLSHFTQSLTMYDETKQEDPEYQKLRELDIYVALRLELQEGLIGYLLLSEKQSGTIFTKQDVNLLEILSQELAVAIQNAKNFEEIQAFSEKLEKEVEEATTELKEKNRRLEELDQAKDDFISMASHQLRTPLTTIKGYLSMLLDGDAGKIPKKQREFIDLSFVSSQRMAHLISDLLNVSRISTGRLTIDQEEFDLIKVAKEELEQLEQQADARGVNLTFHEPDEESIVVNLDEGKMRQVIMNFTDNAVYYAPEGNVDVYIEKLDGAVEFKVKDDGIGVSEEDQKQLFTKFYRAENARHVRPDGTGLGLYMAKQVIEAQDGDIIFESEEGEGSTFGFRFRIGD